VEDAEAREVIAAVRRLVREQVVPLEAQIDEQDQIPERLRRAAAEMGLFGFALPSEHGGLGLSMVQEAELVRELGWTTPAFRSMFGTNNGIAGHTIMMGGSERQKKDWLPKIASGQWTASFALTEAEAGSDPAGLRTTARRTDSGYVLDGAKRFITNAPSADVFMVFARHGSGAPPARDVSVFLVPRDAAGLTVGPSDHKMGQQGALTAEVFLDGVAVPASALIGEAEGDGYLTALRCLAHGRLHIAALCVGMAERLQQETVNYAITRQQSGHPIGEFQLIQAMIADTVTEVAAGRALLRQACAQFDSGEDVRMAPSCAKYYCSEMVGRVADRAVQVHGGTGYMRGVAVERFYRDARLFRIYEGTSQVQQVIIAKQAMARADGAH
jgi:acyl-CoA dehydrogenase